MKTFWLIISILCGLIALGFVLWGNVETAFVIAALGGVAWFLNYRVQLKHRLENDEENPS